METSIALCHIGNAAVVPATTATLLLETLKQLYNPQHAAAGNIVVDGVAASTYNTMLGSEAAMHAFTAAGRVRS
jgi:hypothetical protein